MTWGRVSRCIVFVTEYIDFILSGAAGQSLQQHNIADDEGFNAKSTLWRSPRTNHRGKAVVKWAAELDLQLLNEGSVNTCDRWQGESIVDLSWASPSAARKVKEWRVADELESLSDHRYIVIKLLPVGWEANYKKGEKQRRSDRNRRLEGILHPRWTVKRLDQSRLLTAAHAAAWVAPLEETASSIADKQAIRFQAHMTKICDVSMPRVKRVARNSVYWGSPELDSKKRDCVMAQRRLQHRKRKKTCNEEAEEQLRLRYRAAVVILQRAIRDAKEKAWNELQRTIDKDSWRKPYGNVLDKLRPSAPPLTESLEPGLLERVLNNLFLRNHGHKMAVESNLEDDVHPVPITPEEVNSAIKKMAARNTAPGPDGIPDKALTMALSVFL